MNINFVRPCCRQNCYQSLYVEFGRAVSKKTANDNKHIKEHILSKYTHRINVLRLHRSRSITGHWKARVYPQRAFIRQNENL